MYEYFRIFLGIRKQNKKNPTKLILVSISQYSTTETPLNIIKNVLKFLNKHTT